MLDMQAIALAFLQAKTVIVLLSMHVIVFPGFGDRATELLVHAAKLRYSMLATDGTKIDGRIASAPYIDVGMRMFIPSAATSALLRFTVSVSYENPFLDPEDHLNGFNITAPFDRALVPSDGFLSSEGWVDNLPEHTGVAMFTPKPFTMMPGWFRHPACADVCELKLLECRDTNGDILIKDSCDLLSATDDTVLLTVLELTFQKKDPAARSARPRVVQVGPSGCGTTAIATFYTDLHKLRVAKSFVEGVLIRHTVLDAITAGLDPLHRVDRFDVITDAFDVLQEGLPFCVNHFGAGGSRCDVIDGHSWTDSVARFVSILKALKAAYPNLRFLLNTRRFESWLVKKVHNCWPTLVDSRADWEKYKQVWHGCCDPTLGPGGNASCWDGEAGDKVILPADLPVKSFGYVACCKSLAIFQEVWQEVHAAVMNIGGPDRTVLFHIDLSDPLVLSSAVGLSAGHDVTGWKKVHVSRSRAVM